MSYLANVICFFVGHNQKDKEPVNDYYHMAYCDRCKRKFIFDKHNTMFMHVTPEVEKLMELSEEANKELDELKNDYGG